MNHWVAGLSCGRNWVTFLHVLVSLLVFVTFLSISSNNRYTEDLFKLQSVQSVIRMIGPQQPCANCSTSYSLAKLAFKKPKNILEELLDSSVKHESLRAFRLFDKRFQEDSYFRDHCHTCALVTSSGYLRNSTAGADIDGHQCVLRTNDSPVLGFQLDVGYRTTHRIVAHSSIGKVNRILNTSLVENTTYLVWGPPSTLSPKGRITKWALKALETLKPRPRIYVSYENENRTTTYFDQMWTLENNQSRKITKTWLSTGFFSVVTALNFCDSVTIYGLDALSSCKSNFTKDARYHYYQIHPQPTACSLIASHERNTKHYSHSFETEFKIFHRWSHHRKMLFKVPES